MPHFSFANLNGWSRRSIFMWVDVAVRLENDAPSEAEIRQVEEYVRRNAKVRFYADENFPVAAAEILRGYGAKVITAQEAGLRRHPDENHTAYALRNGYVLVTCDRDYLDNRKFPLIQCPVIVVFDFGGGTPIEMHAAFRCLTGPFRIPQFYDKWMKIDAARDSWTESARFLNGTSARTRYRYRRRRLQQWIENE
jgi:predicted nuclease of predicted toxin-antitoxin system